MSLICSPGSSAQKSPHFNDATNSADAGEVRTSRERVSAQSHMTDSDKRQALERATRAMQRTFLTWHATGCMTAAAAYTEARCTWERMLMTWGSV